MAYCSLMGAIWAWRTKSFSIAATARDLPILSKISSDFYSMRMIWRRIREY
jgi:hypothetical protein